MRATEFAERQYETTFHLGIDAATDPRDAHRIWRVLNGNIPRRMYLTPTLWPHLPDHFYSAISGRVVSLFIQFKVPKFQDGQRAKYRSQFALPYFEVGVT